MSVNGLMRLKVIFKDINDGTIVVRQTLHNSLSKNTKYMFESECIESLRENRITSV